MAKSSNGTGMIITGLGALPVKMIISARRKNNSMKLLQINMSHETLLFGKMIWSEF